MSCGSKWSVFLTAKRSVVCPSMSARGGGWCERWRTPTVDALCGGAHVAPQGA